jgi:hypothetical protein
LPSDNSLGSGVTRIQNGSIIWRIKIKLLITLGLKLLIMPIAPNFSSVFLRVGNSQYPTAI